MDEGSGGPPWRGETGGAAAARIGEACKRALGGLSRGSSMAPRVRSSRGIPCASLRAHAPPHRHQEDHDRGLRSHRHRPGLRVRLLRHPGLQGPAGGGVRGRPPQLQPRHHHDGPGVRRPDLHRAHHARGRGADPRPREARRAPAHPGRARPRSTWPWRWRGTAPCSGTACSSSAPRSRPSRRPRTGSSSRQAMERIGVELPKTGYATSCEEAQGHRRRDRLPHHHPALLHPGRRGRRRRLQPRGVRGAGAARAAAVPTHTILVEESIIGWKEYELEVMRDRTTTSSSSAPSRTSTRWACTPATRSPSRPPRR